MNNESTQKPELKNFYIAYFDILGYKAFFDDEDDHQKFLQDILNIVNDVKNYQQELKYMGDIQYRAFSDNFIFYSEENKEMNYPDFDALCTLSVLMSSIQKKIFEKYGVLIRGAITKGEFYADANIVFGKGLIRAVELEENNAVYPRVVIDKEVFKLSNEHLLIETRWIKQDDDEEYYVNCSSGHEPLINIVEVRNKIIKLIKKYCKYPANYTHLKAILQRERLITKYLWVLEKYNSGCKIGDRINYRLILNARLLKTEVDLL